MDGRYGPDRAEALRGWRLLLVLPGWVGAGAVLTRLPDISPTAPTPTPQSAIASASTAGRAAASSSTAPRPTMNGSNVAAASKNAWGAIIAHSPEPRKNAPPSTAISRGPHPRPFVAERSVASVLIEDPFQRRRPRALDAGVRASQEHDPSAVAGPVTTAGASIYVPSFAGRGLSSDHPDHSPGRTVDRDLAYLDSIEESTGLVGWSAGAHLALRVVTQSDAAAAAALYEPGFLDFADEQRAAFGEAFARVGELAVEGDLAAAARAFAGIPFHDQGTAVVEGAIVKSCG